LSFIFVDRLFDFVFILFCGTFPSVDEDDADDSEDVDEADDADKARLPLPAIIGRG
jgi:hypothetical protein